MFVLIIFPLFSGFTKKLGLYLSYLKSFYLSSVVFNYACLICVFFTSVCFSDTLPPSSKSSLTKSKRKGNEIKLFLSAGELNSPITFKKAKLKMGSKTLNVEIADTPEKRRLGLMHRVKLKDNSGMLFIFDRESIQAFWMKNTFIDLDIGFFNKEKALIEIREMRGLHSASQKDIPRISSQFPAQFALEVPKGWFRKNRIGLGQTFSLQCASYQSPLCEQEVKPLKKTREKDFCL